MIFSFNEFNYLTLIEKRNKERNEKERNLAFNYQFRNCLEGWN